MADEASFLEVLVANERVGNWMDILCDPYQRSRHKFAISQLQQDLQRGTSYVEEATRMGVVQVLTKLLSQTSEGAADLKADEKVMDAISHIIAACSGPMACGGKVCTYTFDGLRVYIREGALGDGLGAKVWAVCHIMCRELLAHPGIVEDQQVLELGSGTGLVGIVAALAGAKQVVLTDYLPEVLINLRTCMHINSAAVQRTAAKAATTQQQQHSGAQSHALEGLFGPAAAAATAGAGAQGASDDEQQLVPDDAELSDNAGSVDDVDVLGMFSKQQWGSASGSGTGSSDGHAAAVAASKMAAWEVDNMCVRHMDWQESMNVLQAAPNASAIASSAAGCGEVDVPHMPAGPACTSHSSSGSSAAVAAGQAPGVPLGQQYPVILGNEVMYEVQHAELVAAAIKHRLQQHGRALLCCAVRDQKVFDAFIKNCTKWGLRYRALRVYPQPGDVAGGLYGREGDYEGGYLLMAIDHAGNPADDWHTDNFVQVS